MNYFAFMVAQDLIAQQNAIYTIIYIYLYIIFYFKIVLNVFTLFKLVTKNEGPGTDPCGTPNVVIVMVIVFPSISCCLYIFKKIRPQIIII